MPDGSAYTGNLFWWLGLPLLGMTVGVIGGLFGIGGNFLLVPALNLIFGIPLDVAIGTGLCQMVGTAVAALRRHSRLKQGEIKIDWLLMAGSLLGVEGGTLAVTRLSKVGSILVFGHKIPAIKLCLYIAYVVLLSLVAIWMLRDAKTRTTNQPLPPGPLTRIVLPPYTWLARCERRVSILVMAYLGLFFGFLSGFLGMGSGIVFIPILLYGIGMRIRMAAGTGVLLLAITAMFGTIAHVQEGHVHLGIAILILAGSTIGAPIGATLTTRIQGHRLRETFAYLLMVTALSILLNLFFLVR